MVGQASVIPDAEKMLLSRLPQRRREGKAGTGERAFCSQPHEVLADWLVVEVQQLPTQRVGQFMTPDPVTVAVDTPLT
jgi:hypothetical protein